MYFLFYELSVCALYPFYSTGYVCFFFLTESYSAFFPSAEVTQPASFNVIITTFWQELQMCSNSYCFHMLKTPYSHLPPPKYSSNNTSLPSPANPRFPRLERISIPTYPLTQIHAKQSTQAKRYQISPLIHLIVWLRKQVFLQVSINKHKTTKCNPHEVVIFSISWEFMKALGKATWAQLWAIDRIGIKGWVRMSGRGKRIMVGERQGNGRKQEDNGHIIQHTLPLWPHVTY